MGTQQSQPEVSRSAARRRQRSTRLTVAVVLLALAAAAVAGGVVVGSFPVLAASAGLAVLLGAAATRITHAEHMDSRRAHAAERAALAGEYAEQAKERAAENDAFVAMMASRLKQREETLLSMEQALSLAQKHALDQTRRHNAALRRAETAEAEGTSLARLLEESDERAVEAIVRVSELEAEIDVLRAEIAQRRGRTARSA